ncbi:flagellar biosynthesis protein FlhA, partial [Candidatus Gastranaerophilus sp. (ex Termes propinquus)]
LMAVSAGIVMSRSSAQGESLGKDLSYQIMRKPQALFFACAFLMLIAVTSPITGLPWWPFVLFTVVFAVAGFSLMVNQDVQAQLGQLDAVKQNMQDLVNPNKMYERLGVDVLSLQVGAGLLVIADPDQDGQLLAKIAALRQRVTDELGYIIPNIRIMDSSAIADNEYLISIRGNTVSTGMVYPGKYMVIADQWETLGKPLPENVIVSVDPTYQSQAYWLDPQHTSGVNKITAVDSVDVIVTHLQDCVRKYVDEVMTKTDVLKLMELVKSQDPTLINDLVPTIISTSDLRKIFVNLIR